jgi:hypothetical protein
MREKPIDANPLCTNCGGPHLFDTSVPSHEWNAVIRAQSLPEYLCTTCIVRAFAWAGRSFSAELYGGGFSGLAIQVIVNGREAATVRGLQDENNLLRRALADIQPDHPLLVTLCGGS